MQAEGSFTDIIDIVLIAAAPTNTENSAERASTNILLGLMQEVNLTLYLPPCPLIYTMWLLHNNFLLSLLQAMDGFLIVLDKEANILYVSETITGYVGLTQVII